MFTKLTTQLVLATYIRLHAHIHVLSGTYWAIHQSDIGKRKPTAHYDHLSPLPNCQTPQLQTLSRLLYLLPLQLHTTMHRAPRTNHIPFSMTIP